MELELHFDDLAVDVIDAQVDVQVLDLDMADAPADPHVATPASFTVSPERPSIRVTVDLPAATTAYEPGLAVRVRGRTRGDGRIEFFNTRATPLPGRTRGPVHVLLSRIG
jgi:uncharacterized lipoprotein YbaY